MNKHEKLYVIIIVVALVLLSFKSLYLDDYEPANQEEAEAIQYFMASDAFKDEWIRTMRVTDLKEEDEQYKVTIQNYLLEIIPYKRWTAEVNIQ